MTSIKEALKIIQRTIKGDQIEAAVVDVGTMMPLGKVVSDALAQLDSADARSAPWRYEVQHGPDGEADYAWVYDEANNLICTAKTHHAKAIVDRLSTGLLPDASPGNGAEKVREALDGLIQYVERNECRHEETSRGGSIWTICDECGQKWADDRGGFIPYQEPSELASARAALHTTSAAGEITSSDGSKCFPSTRRLDDLGSVQDGRKMSTDGHLADAGDTSDGKRQPSKRVTAGETALFPADVLAMKETLQFYADPDNWTDTPSWDGDPDNTTPKAIPILRNEDGHPCDCGDTARKALAAIDKLSPEVKAPASPPDWKQDQAETTRIKPPATAEGGRDEPVAIKPLEWDKHPDEDEWFSHDHGLYDFSEYLVYKSPVSTTAWCLKVRGILLDEDFLGPDAAKAAARNDYEQRIRSALYTHPASPPDVEAIRCAIRDAAMSLPPSDFGSHRAIEAATTAIAALIAGER